MSTIPVTPPESISLGTKTAPDDGNAQDCTIIIEKKSGKKRKSGELLQNEPVSEKILKQQGCGVIIQETVDEGDNVGKLGVIRDTDTGFTNISPDEQSVIIEEVDDSEVSTSPPVPTMQPERIIVEEPSDDDEKKCDQNIEDSSCIFQTEDLAQSKQVQQHVAIEACADSSSHDSKRAPPRQGNHAVLTDSPSDSSLSEAQVRNKAAEIDLNADRVESQHEAPCASVDDCNNPETSKLSEAIHQPTLLDPHTTTSLITEGTNALKDWHNVDEHRWIREGLIRNIAAHVALQTPTEDPEYKDKVAGLSRLLELELYVSAESLAMYSDPRTLKQRLRELAQGIVKATTTTTATTATSSKEEKGEGEGEGEEGSSSDCGSGSSVCIHTPEDAAASTAAIHAVDPKVVGNHISADCDVEMEDGACEDQDGSHRQEEAGNVSEEKKESLVVPVSDARNEAGSI
jgi:hypothetical protein